MLSQEKVIEVVESGRDSKTLDGRDYSRLVDFFPTDKWTIFGFSLKDTGGDIPQPKEWTEENFKAALEDDLKFAFEKALDCRGISAGLMYEVVKMWLWILEDELQNFDEYAQYGLPLFKAVAVKYGFDNPIGDDKGDERKYTEYGE
jgi:hypothetical protein